MEVEGDAALIAESLIDLEALIVEPPRFVEFALVLDQVRLLVQADGDVVLIAESVPDFQTLAVKHP